MAEYSLVLDIAKARLGIIGTDTPLPEALEKTLLEQEEELMANEEGPAMVCEIVDQHQKEHPDE